MLFTLLVSDVSLKCPRLAKSGFFSIIKHSEQSELSWTSLEEHAGVFYLDEE